MALLQSDRHRMTAGELDPQGLGDEADTEPDQDNKYVKRTGSVKRSLQRVMPAIFQPTLPVTTRYKLVAPCTVLAPCTVPLETCLSCYPALVVCLLLMLLPKYAMASEVVHQPDACLCSTSDQYASSNAAAVKPGEVISVFSKLTGLHQTALLCLFQGRQGWKSRFLKCATSQTQKAAAADMFFAQLASTVCTDRHSWHNAFPVQQSAAYSPLI